ncbi:hypothetical protein LPJ61_005722 [Coemansia biformis]|uniref:Uncharacterized protein n=1 Tax=Coemansia biformis TaxID=1286918 RepID=A0A9W7Y4L8_9FUNG|nr:hypothetical protein LPJ61_005722 [Coemansia biformis]
MASHYQPWHREPIYNQGRVIYNGLSYDCYKYGCYTIYARDRKLLLFKTVYSPQTRSYVTRPPIEAWIRPSSNGCHLDAYQYN